MERNSISNMVFVGKMTKQEIKTKLNMSEYSYRNFMELNFSREERKHVSLGMRRNLIHEENYQKVYVDASYRFKYGEIASIMDFLGKGTNKVYMTEATGYCINEMSIHELFEKRYDILVICGSTRKAEFLERAGFKNVKVWIPKREANKEKEIIKV